MKASHTIRPVFDDPNLIGSAGLAPVLRLGEQAGLHDLLEEHLSVESPNAAIKAAGVIAGMLAGANSIDGLDLLRHGGMRKVFTGVRAPSTFGEYLRAFTHGHVQQLAKTNRDLLAGLAGQVPDLLAGGGTDGIVYLGVDDTIREVHGYQKQGAGYGYCGVRGADRLTPPRDRPRGRRDHRDETGRCHDKRDRAAHPRWPQASPSSGGRPARQRCVQTAGRGRYPVRGRHVRGPPRRSRPHPRRRPGPRMEPWLRPRSCSPTCP